MDVTARPSKASLTSGMTLRGCYIHNAPVIGDNHISTLLNNAADILCIGAHTVCDAEATCRLTNYYRVPNASKKGLELTIQLGAVAVVNTIGIGK